MAFLCVHLDTDQEARIKVDPLPERRVVVCIRGDLDLFLSDHQAYELEAALCRHREREAARRRAAGPQVDVDDLLTSMATTYDVRREEVP